MNELQTNSTQWSDCLNYLSHRIKEQTFRTWLKPTIGAPGSNGDFHVSVPNQFVADWIRDHFQELIDEALFEVSGKKHDIIYVVKSVEETEQRSIDFYSPPQEEKRSLTIKKPSAKQHNLHEKYNFESLVVGDFNQFACAAANAVAEAPGLTKYNPLYIYGGTGLGKTHIIQAIGHKILEQFPDKKVMYATSEQFTSDFISSISNHSVADFTKAYRDVDVLIIDDIQFFSGKESTQEQFFHTFNTLYHLGKQIILSSDRSPKDIKGLEERLLSRFSSGLVTDLQAPDMENRSAILMKKLNSEGVTLPDNVIRFIADKVSTNVRELEGALIRLLAYSSLKGESVDLELARKVLADTFSSKKKEVTIKMVQEQTSDHFHIDLEMMKAKKKTSNIALARQVAMYLSRSLTEHSLKTIGDEFGGRDHSTVIHACDLISKKMSSDPSLRDKIDKISASLLY